MIGPVFNDEFGDVYGSIYALTADGFQPRGVALATPIGCGAKLLKVPDVAKVETFGVQAEKLFIEVSQKRLAALGLDFNQVINQLGAQNAVEGAGVLNAGSGNLQVRVQGQLNSVQSTGRRSRSGRSIRAPAWPAACVSATLPRSSATMSIRRA